MRRPARNLLYVVLGFVCVALLVQGVGLKLPGIHEGSDRCLGRDTLIPFIGWEPGRVFGRHDVSDARVRQRDDSVYRVELD